MGHSGQLVSLTKTQLARLPWWHFQKGSWTSLPVNVSISSVCMFSLAFGEDSRSIMVLLMANSVLGAE